MKKIRTQRQDSDSYWFVIDGVEYFLPWNWQIKVDLVNQTYIDTFTDDYKESTLPTLNDLSSQGVDIKMGFPYRKYEISLPSVRVLTWEKARDVLKEFVDNGFPVTMDAIMHNYNAWRADLKSGFRGGGFHLFTPCGCNPLSFRATSLEPSCEDWQTTYVC